MENSALQPKKTSAMEKRWDGTNIPKTFEPAPFFVLLLLFLGFVIVIRIEDPVGFWKFSCFVKLTLIRGLHENVLQILRTRELIDV